MTMKTTTTTTTTTKMSNEFPLPSLQQLDKDDDVSSLSTTHMSIMLLEDISYSLFQVGIFQVQLVKLIVIVVVVNMN
jgi:hypothetical protein